MFFKRPSHSMKTWDTVVKYCSASCRSQHVHHSKESRLKRIATLKRMYASDEAFKKKRAMYYERRIGVPMNEAQGEKISVTRKLMFQFGVLSLKREKNPAWLGGKSMEEYGPDFDDALKEQVRLASQYKCSLCGCSQVENGRHLDVHHIDYDKKNNNLKNLVALCVRCHRKTNHHRKQWTNHFISGSHEMIQR